MELEKTAVNRRIRKWLAGFFQEHLPDVFEGWDEGAKEDVLDAIGKNVENYAYHSESPLGPQDAEYKKTRSTFGDTAKAVAGIKNSLKNSFAGVQESDVLFSIDLRELDPLHLAQ